MGGMAASAHEAGMSVTALVIGGESLAKEAALKGCDEVVAIAMEAGLPPEAYAEAVSTITANEMPQLLLANSSPQARILLGFAAGAIGAAFVDGVYRISIDNDLLSVYCEVADGIAKELRGSMGPVAGVFVGHEVSWEGQVAPVRFVEAAAWDARIVNTEISEDTGLDTANRIVGVGMGVRADAFESAKILAQKMGAEIACTLPVCDDRHWMPSSRVLGSSHNQSSPNVYLAIGVSGSPNHLSGVRDAKIKVAINKDPNAPIFKHADYGLVGDADEIIPELIRILD